MGKMRKKGLTDGRRGGIIRGGRRMWFGNWQLNGISAVEPFGANDRLPLLFALIGFSLIE